MKSGLGRSDLSAALAWLGAAAYTFQIYFDFSGYSDMAIGLGEMFGFHFPENFNYPYESRNITEFWRRWHMTLSGWFREYLYIPLGGNKKGMFRQILNLLIVWFLTGLWHGAGWNFILKTVPVQDLNPPAFYPAACICTVLDYPWLGHICLRRAWADEKIHKDDGRNRSACGQPACII